jgi:hypothetical protein
MTHDQSRRFQQGLRQLRRLAPVAFVTLVGCGAPTTELSAKAEKKAQELTPSLDSLLCNAMDALKGVAQFAGIDEHCTAAVKTPLYYEGGFVPANNLGDLFKLPPLTNTMIQCAVTHSDGAVASEGVGNTPVGKFGVESHLSVIDRSVTPQHVEAERLGRIFLFDVPADLDIEDIHFLSRSENRPAGTIDAARVFSGEPYTQNVDARTGEYLEITSNNRDWTIGAKDPIKVPAGPIEVLIKPSLTHTPFYESINNQLVAPASDVNTLFDFNTQLGPELNCIAACTPTTLCVCQSDPSSSQLAEHERTCPGGSCDYANLNDGILPFDGALGGATQNSLYDIPMVNWFHFGPPGTGGGLSSGKLASGQVFTENAYDLDTPDKAKQNTQFSLHLDAGYSLGPATLAIGIQTDVNFRSSFALRQSFAPGPDRPGQQAVIETALDSQSSVDVQVELLIDFGLFSFNPKYTIWNAATGNTPRPLTTINYAPQEDSAVGSFAVSGQLLDANGAIGECLQDPTSLTPLTPPSDPGDFLNKLGPSAVAHIHPCHVAICNADGTQLTTCNWDSHALSLNCSTDTVHCSPCSPDQNLLQMCGIDDQPLHDQNGNPVETVLIPSDRGCIR